MTHEEVRELLLRRCVDEGLFEAGITPDADADLVDGGQLDSMGLVRLQALIEDCFGLELPTALFVAELRSLSRLARYLERELRGGRARLSSAAE